jgi:hypothetical protein
MTLDAFKQQIRQRRTRRAIAVHQMRRAPIRPLIYPSDLYPRMTQLPR